MNIEWPEMFITGEIPEDLTRKNAVADALCAWGICSVGVKPTKKFGEVLAKLSQRFGIPFSPDKLSKEADKIIKEKKVGDT
jgi:hypothetical protein